MLNSLEKVDAELEVSVLGPLTYVVHLTFL